MRYREMRGLYTPEKFISVGVGTSPFSKMKTPGKSPMRSLHRLESVEEEREEEFAMDPMERPILEPWKKPMQPPPRPSSSASNATWTSSERNFLISRTPKTGIEAPEPTVFPIDERLGKAKDDVEEEACIKEAATICKFRCFLP